MKLWKSKKPIVGCVPGKSAALKQDQQQQQQESQNNTFNGGHHHPSTDTSLAPMLSVDRAMSPAQSEDSGLAPERGTTYATITLPRNALHLAITFAERNDLSYPPVVGSLSPVGHAADFLAPGDRLHQIDGISTIGLSNQKVMNMLCTGGSDAGPAIVEIEYSLPEYTVSQNSLCVTSKLAQITVERESGCLGLTLRGGADYPLIVTHVRPHGPVYKTGRIKPGDRLLRVDNVSLIGKTLAEAQQIIKCGGHVSGYTNLTIEYDVSVVQSVEFSMGPLLIEIERPMNDKLGLVLCNYTPAVPMPTSGSGSSTPSSGEKIEESAGVFIASILPASIADRCGALSVGDQVLSIDDTMIEHTAFSPDEVMTILDTSTGRGYTQMQIMPAHALARRGHTALGSPKYSFSTLESRKSSTAGRQRQRFARKSSLPLENPVGTAGSSSTGGSVATTGIHGSSSLGMGLGLCRAESFPVLLDCSHGAGIMLAESGSGGSGSGSGSGSGGAVAIAQILADSVADRSGCIQAGDRIVAINKMYSLDAAAMRQLLEGGSSRNGGGNPTGTPANWLELEIEFDMPDAVVPSSGVFSVKLLRAGKCGLGLSVSGSSHGGLVISDVKMGSPAHRSGSLRSGDILLAVDQHPVQHFNVDALLKEEGSRSQNPSHSSSDFTTLTIKRIVLPDFLPMSSPIYSNCPASGINLGMGMGVSTSTDHDLYSSAYVTAGKYADCVSLKSRTPQPDYFRVPSMDDASLQSVQMRSGSGSGSTGGGGGGGGQANCWSTGVNSRSFVAPPNTQSLTTELPEEEDEQEQLYSGYELNRYASVDCTALPPPMENKVYGSAASSSSKSSGSSLHQIIFTVRLEPKGGLLGITLAGSEDITKPITISGLVEGGIAHKNGQIHVSDQLLAIDEHSVQGMPLSHATSLLQNLGDLVDLKILRSHDLANGSHLPQTQAIYAKVQRRPRSPSANTEGSKESGNGNANGNGSTNGNGSVKPRVFHVTLYKDKVYDDYGFSVSDGLYERGVFINRIRSGGPADMCGLLKPFDRIMQVNEMKTQDFDCCLTVPLIAAAGDKIEMIMQRTE